MFRLNIGIVVGPALPRRYRKAVETAVRLEYLKLRIYIYYHAVISSPLMLAAVMNIATVV